MKQRFRLIHRGSRNTYYCVDTLTNKRESLNTNAPSEARRLVDAKNEALNQSAISLALAKVYLTACDPKFSDRDWNTVIVEFCRQGKQSTRSRRERAVQHRAFNVIRTRKLTETTTADFKNVLEQGGVFVNHCLRGIQNLALGFGWLPWPVIPSKLWPEIESKEKRGITRDEHERIIQAEKNVERRTYYELLWEIGASQSDGAELKLENINWENRTISYLRKKTGELAVLSIGCRLEEILKQLPKNGFLFPKIAAEKDSYRAAEFRRRCRILKIEGISLHSYRYAWAERAKTCGYPERFAQQALGHNSKAVHRAYAKHAQVTLPPLEQYERKIVQLPKCEAA